MNKLLMTLASVALLLMTGCNHKELCYLHPHGTKIRVVYNWSEAPEASPAGMCAFFYPLDYEGSHRRFDFPGARGGEIEIPEGRYLLITYNNDTEAVQFLNHHDFDQHRAFTRIGDILEPMYGNGVKSSVRAENDEQVVITPDGLWGCTATEVNITDHGISYIHETSGSRAETYDENGNQIITLYPHDLLCHYSYEVRNVKNAKHISKVSGALSGMSGAMNLATEGLDPVCVTLPVEAAAHGDDKTITGEFLTFGHHADNTSPHRMQFYVVMDDGAKYSFTTGDNLDVTPQVDNAPNRRRVHLIIDGLDLPQPIENGNGLKPSVEDWGVVRQDLQL